MRFSKEDYEATKFLGGTAGAKFPHLRKIAMVRQEERELIGAIRISLVLIKENKFIENFPEEPKLEDLKKYYNKILIPMLTAYGEACFKQSEITHLSMKIGSDRQKIREDLPEF